MLLRTFFANSLIFDVFFLSLLIARKRFLLLKLWGFIYFTVMISIKNLLCHCLYQVRVIWLALNIQEWWQESWVQRVQEITITIFRWDSELSKLFFHFSDSQVNLLSSIRQGFDGFWIILISFRNISIIFGIVLRRQWNKRLYLIQGCWELTLLSQIIQ